MRILFLALALPFVLAAQPSHKLIVIAIDGLDAHFLNDPGLHVKAPNIRRLMRQGTVAIVSGVAPSETVPSDISLVTGVPPEVHGIGVTGRLTEAARAEEIRSTTLWQAAAKAGLKSATVYWPATLGAEVAFDFPEYYETLSRDNIQFDPIARRSTPAGLAERVEVLFPGFRKELWDDSSSTNASCWLLTSEKPDLLLIRFSELETEQHEAGPLSVYARGILEDEDDLIGQILAKMPRGTIVAIVSGHGVESENYVVRPRVMLKQASIEGSVEVSGGLIGTANRGIAEYFRKLLNDGHRHGLAREVPIAEVRAKIPSLDGWLAAFDTPPNYVAIAEERGPAIGPGTHHGVSGLWPGRPGYHSVFVIAGDGVRSQRLGEIDLLQIAPTFADVLGVKLPRAKNRSLWPIISAGSEARR